MILHKNICGVSKHVPQHISIQTCLDIIKDNNLNLESRKACASLEHQQLIQHMELLQRPRNRVAKSSNVAQSVKKQRCRQRSYDYHRNVPHHVRKLTRQSQLKLLAFIYKLGQQASQAIVRCSSVACHHLLHVQAFQYLTCKTPNAWKVAVITYIIMEKMAQTTMHSIQKQLSAEILVW